VLRVTLSNRQTPCNNRGRHEVFGPNRLITRFEGRGEVIRLDPVNLPHLYSSDELLSVFLGKNTPERQDFIIDKLHVEKDLVEA